LLFATGTSALVGVRPPAGAAFRLGGDRGRRFVLLPGGCVGGL